MSQTGYSSALNDLFEQSELVKTSILCTLTITGSVCVLMNVFVLTVVWRYTWMRTNANLIIASMAVTDLVEGLSAITHGLITWGDFFTVGYYFCSIFPIIDVTVAIASLQHVLAVNIERYVAITKPLQYKKLFPRKMVYLYILAIWVYSFGIGVMYVFNTELLDRCLFGAPKNAAWSLIILHLVYPVPLFTIIGIYIRISAVIVRQMNFVRDHSSSRTERITSQQMKLIQSVGSIFAAYLICWAPKICIHMAASWALLLGIDLHLSDYVMMIYFFEVLYFGNSLINPVIYFLSSGSFQRAAKQMFRVKNTTPAREDRRESPTRRTENRDACRGHIVEISRL